MTGYEARGIASKHFARVARVIRHLAGLAIALALAGCDGGGARELASAVASLRTGAPPAEREWRHYLGDAGSSQFSTLSQISRENVHRLERAWTYDPGHAGLIPTNPLVVGGVLYGLDGHKNVFALDAATGEELWVHPFDRANSAKGAGRGLVYWEGRLAGGEQARWILVGQEERLYALDAMTGELADAFGGRGFIDLRAGLDRDSGSVNVSANSPGTLFGDLLIMGFATSEDYSASPGHIRAYQLPGGELRWTFRTVPAPGEFGSDTWPAENPERRGGANAWAGLTLDQERGIVFVPTGSAGYDFYGANRAGDNLFANCLIALDARTGERLWHYQVVRHDLWDRDLPSPPNLVEVRRNGELIPAVAQATKSGHLFVFHRETGEPLFPIEEVPVAGDGLPGEHLAVSQPLPVAPPPFANQHFQINDLTPESAAAVARQIEGMATNQAYPAPSQAGIVLYPGLDGGAEWGGQAWDAGAGLLYVNASEAPWSYPMEAVAAGTAGRQGPAMGYKLWCANCHGRNREGFGDVVPSLQGVASRYWPWELWRILREGRGRMPAFGHQPWYYTLAPFLYLYTGGEEEEQAPRREESERAPGWAARFTRPLDPNNLPGSRPPWGSLTAIHLDTGSFAWRIPLGDYPQALAMGWSGLGAENYGGPVVTAGGLLFIAATPDSRIRAFDKTSGELLWEDSLPAAGFATPAVYEAGGRQFLVIAAGGGRLGQPLGSGYVAYALPAD